ncbi:MAG: hypothetical protein SNJ75_05195 [Gemmataceae bacterium]
MSIIRVGLSETKDFSEGWDRIFGKKDSQATSETSENKPETPSDPHAPQATTSNQAK